MSFAEGFFTTSANAITARKMEIRDRRAKDRDYLMTYGTQAITKAREGADAVSNIAGILQSEYNFSPKNIAFLVDKTGVAGLSSLYDKVKDFTSQEAKASDFNSLFKGIEDYDYNSEKDLKQQIEKAFGLYKSNVTTDPQENERVGFLASLGLDIFNDGGEEFTTVGGYNIEDARRIGATPAASMSNPLGSIFDTTKLPRKLNNFELSASTDFVEEAIEGIARAYVSDNNLDGAKAGSTINKLITTKDWATLSAMPELKEELNIRFSNYEKEYNVLGSNPAVSYLKKNGLLDIVDPNQTILNRMNRIDDYKKLGFPIDISDVPTFETEEALNKSGKTIGIVNGKIIVPEKIDSGELPIAPVELPANGGPVIKTMADLTESEKDDVLGIVKELVDKEVNAKNAKRRKGRIANNMSDAEETALRESLSETLLPAAIKSLEDQKAPNEATLFNPRKNIGG